MVPLSTFALKGNLALENISPGTAQITGNNVSQQDSRRGVSCYFQIIIKIKKMFTMSLRYISMLLISWVTGIHCFAQS